MSRPRGNPNMKKGFPSINPSGGGRKAVAKLIDALGLGENTKEAFEFLRDVMRGDVKDPRNPALTLDAPLALRVQCATFLIEKRTGKAAAQVDVEVGGEVTHTHYNLGAYTEAQLEQLEKLLNMGASDDVVDAEIVSQVSHEPAALPE